MISRNGETLNSNLQRRRSNCIFYFRILYRAAERLAYDGGLAIASNVALSLLLSLFPFLMLIAALVRLYGDPTLADAVVELVLGHWPGDAAKPIAEQIQVLLSEPAGEFFSISTIVALILATNGVENARDGLNRAYKLDETRSFFWRRLQATAFVLLGAMALIFATFLLVGAPLAWSFLSARLPILPPYSVAFSVAKYGLAFLILGLVLFAFHRFLPNRRQRKRHILWGILLTIVIIFAGSWAFGLYLKTIANYTALYAGLAGMMIAIVYLYCLAAVILYGAEFNTALAEERAARKALRESGSPGDAA
ncbi:YihY/virulence factor BrkB family protein [Pseudahrensia aquimaris]|uniref:YihY/virulence factor BrkB family protein n=1 Tax=Pseudahrensia aquimaris TaxID=744461 RepID=A0ABW3FG12_9HYPH